jgi:hypothetical protein
MDVLGKKDDSKDFRRGYYRFPTSFLAISKNYSPSAYLLANHLITEKGNLKLNTAGDKVVAFQIGLLMDVMHINAQRVSRKRELFMRAIREIGFIKRTEPNLTLLEGLKTADFEKTKIRIFVDSDVNTLDESLRSNLLGAKSC